MMRLRLKAFTRNIRDHFSMKYQTEEACGLFLDWLEDECMAVQALEVFTDEDD